MSRSEAELARAAAQQASADLQALGLIEEMEPKGDGRERTGQPAPGSVLPTTAAVERVYADEEWQRFAASLAPAFPGTPSHTAFARELTRVEAKLRYWQERQAKAITERELRVTQRHLERYEAEETRLHQLVNPGLVYGDDSPGPSYFCPGCDSPFRDRHHYFNSPGGFCRACRQPKEDYLEHPDH